MWYSQNHRYYFSRFNTNVTLFEKDAKAVSLPTQIMFLIDFFLNMLQDITQHIVAFNLIQFLITKKVTFEYIVFVEDCSSLLHIS